MKKAIIIGATSGMGRGLAKLLADKKFHVGITGRRVKLLEALKNENPDSFIIRPFDLMETPQIARNMEELVRELGGLDLLIISAGYGDLNEPLDFVIEKQTIDINVLGFTAVADWGFNYFKDQKSGHLVGITSIAGIRGHRSAPAYNATKAYQINYLESLRQKAYQLKLPITVTDIRPGFVDTAMAKSEVKFWMAPVEKAVKQIDRAISHKRSVAYITNRWSIVAFLYKLLPRYINNHI